MSLGTAAPRRKMTTYGKVSRKPVNPSANAFAMNPRTDVWDVQSDLHWRIDSASTRTHPACARDRPVACETSVTKLVSKPTKPRIKEQDRAPLATCSIATESGSLTDIPSLDDLDSYESKELMSGPRKRRKVSPDSGTQIGRVVYDDVTLQRHVAAEYQRDLNQRRSRSSQPSSQVASGKNGHSAVNIAREDEAMKRLSTLEKQRGSSKAQTPPKHNFSVRTLKDQKPGTVSLIKSRARETSGRPAKESLTSTKPSWKAKKTSKGTSKDIGVFTKPEAVSTSQRVETAPANLHLSERGNPKKRSPSEESLHPPSTPPKPIRHKDGTSTPRQRELWSKLLVDDSAIASPSALDLPSLTLAHTKSTTSWQSGTACKAICQETEDLHPREPRPRKLVDTLQPKHHDENRAEGHDSQDSDSLCSISSSECADSSTLVKDDFNRLRTSSCVNDQKRVKQSHSSNDSKPIPSIHGAGLKVTYARQRSFLTDNDLDEVAMLNMPIIQEPVVSQGLGALGPGQPLPMSQSMGSLNEDVEASQDSQGGAMRSIHELREAGGNVRLLGELEAILDDIEEGQSVSRGLQPTRLIDLVAKLQDPSNCRLFVDQGLESRLLAYAGIVTDLISKSLIAAAILQLVAGSISTLLLSQISHSRIVNFLIALLEHNQDLTHQVKLREHNLSKYAQSEYKKVCTAVLESTAWRAGKPTVFSCHVLALQCLEYLVRQIRESGSLSNILSADAIRQIVLHSIPAVAEPLPRLTPMSAIHLELTLSILESCTVSNSAEPLESLWEGATLERIMTILPLLMEDDRATSRTLTLRLYCNLTNNNPRLCEDFSEPQVVEALFKTIIEKFEQLSKDPVKQQYSMLSDTLILSLGAFVNLAESSSVVRQLVLDLFYGSHNYLDVLVELFKAKSKNAAEVKAFRSIRKKYTDMFSGLLRGRDKCERGGWVSVCIAWFLVSECECQSVGQCSASGRHADATDRCLDGIFALLPAGRSRGLSR